MGSETETGEVALPKGGNELLQAQALLFNHIFKPVGAMSLKCAVELGIPDAVHRHGGPIALPDLLSALSIPAAKAADFRRLMRVLSRSGLFRRAGGDSYSLTPLSRLLVGESEDNHSPLLLMMLHPIHLQPLQLLSAWFRDDGEARPFSRAHGCGFWDMTGRDPAFGRMFDEGLASDARLLMAALLEDHKHVFDGLTSLVDVGGGNGSAAGAIAEAFPRLRCSVLELPQVVEGAVAAKERGRVELVAGDMFRSIPPANAVLLKCVLHNWGDEECVKILQRCREAIPSREDGGKVIIIDIVVGSVGNNSSQNLIEEAQLSMDIWMMAKMTGVEREEEEWKNIFVEAGFAEYKITPLLGLRSLIELYP